MSFDLQPTFVSFEAQQVNYHVFSGWPVHHRDAAV